MVLDDYQVIKNETIHNAVAFLLDHIPPQLHLVITSRVDPFLPLARLRARNQLLEIRASDLRFQLNETAEFVEQDSEIKAALAGENIALLSARTEGWATGLQLALLWLKKQENKVESLRKFSGNNRFVLEYLTEEVLAFQPKPVRTFLLETSLLGRFNTSLANAVTGLEWSNEDLHQLEQANLFLITLDEEGEWYRYHHLFAEFLQYRLKQEAGITKIKELNLRASLWSEQQGFIIEAIEYALAAPDFQRAADLITQIGVTFIMRGELTIFDRWISKIPPEFLNSQPYLRVCAAFSANLKGQLVELSELVALDETSVKALGYGEKLGHYFHILTHLKRAQNDLAATLEFTKKSLETVPPPSPAGIVVYGSAPALVYLNQGAAKQLLSYVDKLISSMKQQKSFLGRLFPGFILADLYLLQGDLPKARYVQEEIIKMSTGTSVPSVISNLRLGNIYLEWNEIDQDQIYLSKVKEQFLKNKRQLIPPGYYHYAGLWWPEGDRLPVIDWSGATIEEIEQYWQGNFKFQLEAFERRLGPKPEIEERITGLEEWCALTFPGGYPALQKPLEYQREPQYLTFARILIHQGKFEEAVSLLQELYELAQSQGRIHNQIKILIVLALAYQTLYDSNRENNGQPGLALNFLGKALSLAEPGNYIMTFVEEGKPLQQLLLQILPSLKDENLKLYSYGAKLLAVFGSEQVAENPPLATQEIYPQEIPAKESTKHQAAGLENNRNLAEPLTERELNVLRLIANGASNQEISSELVISLSTVKKHSSNIFSKLGVGNRTQALIRAKELNLL